jgi:hypothetical protein
MNENFKCHSCGMPIESGTYCQHCTDDTGALQSFEERIARMSQFMKHQNPGLTDQDARHQSLSYMATMPAWKNHPRVLGRKAE